MTNEEAIHKLEYSKKAYQMLIDEKVDNGKLVGKDITGEWKAKTPLNEVYKNMIEALDMAIKALELEPCEDCVSREEVIKLLRAMWVKHIPMEFDVSLSFVLGAIDEIESVTPERPNGKWEYVQYDRPSIGNYHCSLCRCIGEPTNYCPNCGAKMVEPQERSCKECGK